MAISSALRIRQSLPDGFLTCSARDLYRIVPEPTLFHLDGRAGENERLFVSILLHGDETAGLMAMQNVLSRQAANLHRPLSLFIGNVEAAKIGVRRLDEQTDFNRCWPGGASENSPEGAIMRQLLEEMSRHPLFASIDIHNNTGSNPHYGCINRLESRYIYLASLFSNEIVYFIRPQGVQSMAFAALCPAVTLECGSIGDKSGVEHAAEYVGKVMQLDSLMPRKPFTAETRVYHTMANIRIPDDVSFSFDGKSADIMFSEGFEYRNFHQLKPGFRVAKLNRDMGTCLQVIDETGLDKSEHYFENRDGTLVLRQPVIPAMLTSSEKAVRQDCLGYLMEILQI